MVMAWLAIENGKEIIYDRDTTRGDGISFSFIELPRGSIKKLTGRQLKKGDEPIDLNNIREVKSED